MNHFSIVDRPFSSRPCVGLGVQTDCYIYDDINRQFGVDDIDYARWERRLRAVQPGVARIFLPTTEFNPSGDGHTYDWHTVEMQRQYRNLAILQVAGARVNVCMGPWTNMQMTQPGSERWAVDLVEHLVRERGFEHIGWLTLFNEPDAIYAPETALNRDLEARGFGGGLPFANYVEKHQRTLELLQARGLNDQVRLVIGDMAWPPQRRQEWLELLHREVSGTPVAYSFHHYAPDEDIYDRFFAHPDAQPFRPAPLAEEVRRYREAVGADAELVCWEFNEPGWNMGTAAWLGVGPYGEDHYGTFAAAVAHTRKALTMLAHGVDGLSHWCVGDMFYRSGLQQGVMYCGLWRYKWEGWVPRPVYFYYTALIEALRPGMMLHRLDGVPAGVTGIAARQADRTTLVLLNHSDTAVAVPYGATGATQRLRIAPHRVPHRPDASVRETDADGLPLADWQDVSLQDQGCAITIEPGELTLLKTQYRP